MLLRCFAILSLIAVTTSSVYAAPSLDSLYGSKTLVLDMPSNVIARRNVWRSLGQEFDEMMGIKAFSNVRNGRYQCTELTHRFLSGIYGIPARIGIGLGHANVVLRNIYRQFGSRTYRYNGEAIKMKLMTNGQASEPPAPGSAINFTNSIMGHVAIVRYVEVLSATSVRLYLFEQHGFPAWSVGQTKPIRTLRANKAANGKWTVNPGQSIGTTVNWLNFEIL